MRAPANMVKMKPEHVRYVSERMRPDEIEQFVLFCGHAEYRPAALVSWVNTQRGPAFTVMDKHGLPAACGGYSCIEAGLWRSWMFGTERGWTSCGLGLTRASRWLIDGLLGIGAKRLETTVLASRTKAIEWYERSLKLSRVSEDNGVVTFARCV